VSTIQRIRWDDWRGGDRGHLSMREAGRRQPPRYDAENLVFDERAEALVYRTGAQHVTTFAASSGRTHVGMGWAGIPGAELWVALRDNASGNVQIRLVNLATFTSTLISTIGPMALGGVVSGVWMPAGVSYLTVPGVGLYKLNHLTSTLTLIDGTLGGWAIAHYGERLYVGGNVGGSLNRVRFSDALNMDSYPALNFFDVGPGQQVRFLAAQRGHLTIALEDGTWWVLNGLANAGGVLRRVSGGGQAPWQFYPTLATVRGDDAISFVPIIRDYPASFNGATVEVEDERSIDDDDLGQPGAAATRYTVVRMVDPDEVAFRSGSQPSRLLVNRRGAWTRHLLGSPSSTPFMASDDQGWLYLACTEGADQAVCRITFADIEPGESINPARPLTDATGTGTFAAAHDAHLTLPEWWHPDGADVTVRSVTVEVRGWGAARPAPTLSCQAKALGRADVGEAASSVITRSLPQFDGVRSVTFGFGEQGAGRGCQVLISGIRHLSVLSVTADVAVDPARQGR
jgi:hypothetical protein